MSTRLYPIDAALESHLGDHNSPWRVMNEIKVDDEGVSLGGVAL